MYKDIIIDCICADIKKARDNGILAGSVILTLSAIDAMAFLSMPLNQTEVTGKDYINWVDKYMRTGSNQSYQYKGIDLWGARCGIVHRYGAISKLSEKEECKIFNYHNGREHIYKQLINKNVVDISIKRFAEDFFIAVNKFLQDIEGDNGLKRKVDNRIGSLFVIKGRNRKKIQQKNGKNVLC